MRGYSSTEGKRIKGDKKLVSDRSINLKSYFFYPVQNLEIQESKRYLETQTQTDEL